MRIALGYKGIDYESRMVNGQDRTQAVEDYGVPLTPGITGDGYRLYDSNAILRYLDLNYPGPRYLPIDADALREVEQWNAGRAMSRSAVWVASLAWLLAGKTSIRRL